MSVWNPVNTHSVVAIVNTKIKHGGVVEGEKQKANNFRQS